MGGMGKGIIKKDEWFIEGSKKNVWDGSYKKRVSWLGQTGMQRMERVNKEG